MKGERVIRWEKREFETLKFFSQEASALASRVLGAGLRGPLGKDNAPESGQGI